MALPSIQNNPNITNFHIDEALAKGLDKDGLMRVKAVEEAVKFSMGKSPTVQQVDELIEKFYNRMSNKQTKD